MERYGDQRHVNGGGNTDTRPDLDFTFNTRLKRGGECGLARRSLFPGTITTSNNRTLTIVAEIPGYPIRKLPFGGPETRTKAAILQAQYPHHHGPAAVERDALRDYCGEVCDLDDLEILDRTIDANCPTFLARFALYSESGVEWIW